MFTGIIEEKGRFISFTSGRIVIGARKVLEGTRIGDSIAVNGVCLTVTQMGEDRFEADVMEETLRRSGLGRLRPGSGVNLERAMALGGRFGGHIVSGHIDGTGRVRSVEKEGNARWITIAAPEGILRYIVEKGSIAIDGISLTVAALGRDEFSVSIIPHTGSETILGDIRVGDEVNLENDIMAKYAEKLIRPYAGRESPSGSLTMEYLEEMGI